MTLGPSLGQRVCIQRALRPIPNPLLHASSSGEEKGLVLDQERPVFLGSSGDLGGGGGQQF